MVIVWVGLTMFKQTFTQNFCASLKVVFAVLILSSGPVSANTWLDLDENEGYTARHEASFVQAGDRF